jgi:hypothetical protein
LFFYAQVTAEKKGGRGKKNKKNKRKKNKRVADVCPTVHVRDMFMYVYARVMSKKKGV